MKTTPKTRALAALKQLVNQWHNTRARKQKLRLTAQLSAANDRFYARWGEDGVARLLRECAGATA